MALPVGLPVVVVSMGPYTDSKGVPYSGTVTFRPSTPLVWAATGAVVLDGVVTATLDVAGSASISLPATDAVGLSVVDFTYTVSFSLKSAGSDRAEILPILVQLPQAAPTVDLDVLQGMTSAGGVTVGLPSVVSVAGLSGAVSVAALRTALGLGSAAYVASTAFDAAGAATAAQAAAVASSAQRASNLSDLTSASSARTNLGLGTSATQPSTAFDAAGSAATAQAAAVTAAGRRAVALSIVFGG